MHDLKRQSAIRYTAAFSLQHQMTSRRRFFKVGIVGAGLLAAGGAFLYANHDPVAQRRTVLTGVVAGILSGVDGLTAARIQSTVLNIEKAIAGLAPHAQTEIAQLFALLASSPGRWLAGVDQWDSADPEKMRSFLTEWRHHKIALFQVGYQALHDLVTGTYYSDETTWQSIGYAGPLKL